MKTTNRNIIDYEGISSYVLQTLPYFNQVIYDFTFGGYIVLPEKFNLNHFIIASVLIEDIHAEQLDARCIYNNITKMLVADLC